MEDSGRTGIKMPLLFVGHGSPMNAIEENEFVYKWRELGSSLPKPHAILCISAHWETKGTFVTAMERPQTIHDFGGFPKALYEVQYPAPGSPELAKELAPLRNKGVLIIGSGNIVHNLGMVGWDKLNDNDYGYDWAIEAKEKMKILIADGDHQPLIDYKSQGRAFNLSIPTPEHFLPILYILGLKDKNEKVSIFNDKNVAGSLAMTSVIIDIA
jgi:4,5-DOPA dioxygenase extradiol